MNKKISFGKISANFSQNSDKIEATGTFGTFGPPQAIQVLEDDTESQQMKNVMGISNFGKKAKSFDIKEMIAQVKATAKEITKQPEEEKVPDSEDDSEDDFIGPPVPANLVIQKEEKIAEKSKNSDDSDEEEIDSNLFIPCTHEAQMVHGNKAVTALCVDPSGARLASGKVISNISIIVLLIHYIFIRFC